MSHALRQLVCARAALLALGLVSPGLSGAQETTAVPTIAIAPQYPAIAILARVQGIVVLVVEIDAAGAPVGIAVKRTVPLLVESAREAARLWRFPAGDARSQEVTFAFTLDGGDGRDGKAPRVQFESPYKVTVTAHAPLVCSCGPKGGVCFPATTGKPQ